MSFWDWILWAFAIFLFMAYLMVLFSILRDLFRDHSLNGWWKAVWIIFLLFVPFLTALIYLIARGQSMNARALEEAKSHQAAQAEYIRAAAGGAPSATDEIARAKGLLDAGAISQAEYEAIKAKALA